MAIVTANDGKQFDPDSLALTIGRNGDGTVAYLEVRWSNKQYRQNFTYVDGDLTAIGGWCRQ